MNAAVHRLFSSAGLLAFLTRWQDACKADAFVLVVSAPVREWLLPEESLSVLGRDYPLLVVDRLPACPTSASYAEALEHVGAWLELHAVRSPVVAGIGGGTALDMAKLVRAAFRREFRCVLHDAVPLLPPLLLVPSTAGSGAEVLPRVILADPVRIRLLEDHAYIPDDILLCPELCESQPAVTRGRALFSAIARCIESYWAVRSSSESRAHSWEGLRLLWKAVASLQEDRFDHASALEGAYLSGCATAMSRTSVVESLAHQLVSRLGMSYGDAIAILLPEFFRFVAGVGVEDCTDQRGAAFVKRRIMELSMIIGGPGSDAEMAAQALEQLRSRLGLMVRLPVAVFTQEDELGEQTLVVNRKRLQGESWIEGSGSTAGLHEYGAHPGLVALAERPRAQGMQATSQSGLLLNPGGQSRVVEVNEAGIPEWLVTSDLKNDDRSTNTPRLCSRAVLRRILLGLKNG